LARSRAAAQGVSLPRRGTFQDVLLQEVDYRERNLRLAEMSIFVAMFQQLLSLTAELIPTSDDRLKKLKAAIVEDSGRLLSRYEAELYQDRYLPEYQRLMREVSRREKAEAEEKRRREQEAFERVAALGGDEEASQ
jgi:tRNA uridine 5-carbamoylmethylation protein Kti12